MKGEGKERREEEPKKQVPRVTQPCQSLGTKLSSPTHTYFY